MKQISAFLVIALLSLPFISDAQNDSTYYYNPDGTKSWWYLQEDVFCFRTIGGNDYSGTLNTTIIDAIEYSPYTQRQQIVIKFSALATSSQRLSEIDAIIQSGTVEYSPFTVTRNKSTTGNYVKEEYVLTNDLILVNFIDPNISQQEVNSFISRNALSVYHQPNSTLPVANWTYVFHINPDKWNNTFEASRTIFSNESALIEACIPDMGLAKPDACQPVAEMNDFAATTVPDALWHIRNQGSSVSGGTTGGSGTNDADADICECWGEGYHGQGIKVAVIDFGGFDYTHPDMQGQFLTGWNMINSTSHTTSFYNPSDLTSHGMATCGVIAAKANAGLQYSAVGVAYDAEIIPILTDFQTSTIRMSIQQAVDEGADVINLSFGYNDNSIGQSVYFAAIKNARNTGRNGLGCVVIASTGNDELDIRHWPAADSIAFGAGATDPNDYRGSHVQANPWTWNSSTSVKGSNYLTPLSIDGNNPRYNVVAPGTRIYTAWTDNPLSNPNQLNGPWTGTSFAAPLTAGVAAIILSKNGGLSEQQVKDAIQNNADIIRTSTYNYSNYSFLPGYNKEVFYGRINCLTALNGIPVSIEELNPTPTDAIFSIAYLNDNEIGVFFKHNTNANGTQLALYDISGKLIDKQTIVPHSYSFILNTSSISKGIYIINITDNRKQYHQSVKFIK